MISTKTLEKLTDEQRAELEAQKAQKGKKKK